MSQEPDLRPDPDAPEPESEPLLERLGHSVEGAVETAEHQIEKVEETVEHALDPVVEALPEAAQKPVRWAVAKLVLLALATVIGVVLLGVLAVGYYMWNHTQFASHELTGRLNRMLRDKSDVELSLDGLRGNPLKTVTVVRPRIRYRGSSEAPVLEASTMRLSYSTWDLLWGKRGAIVIEMDHPIVRIGRGPDGRLRIPKWKEGSAGVQSSTKRSFDFVLQLRNGEVDAPETELDVHGLDMDLRLATDPTLLDVRSVSWKQGPYGSRLEKLTGALAVGDSVVIAVRELRSSDLDLRGKAAWQRRGGEKKVWVDVSRLRWRWLGQVIRNNTLNVDGEGTLRVEAEGDPVWRGRAQASGIWDDLPVEARTDFRWRNHRLFLEGLQGRSPAGNIAGRLQHGSDGWWIEANATDADPSKWAVLGIHDWPAGNAKGWFRYTVDTRRAKRAHLDTRLSATDWAGWHADSGVVAVDFPPAPPVRFTVHAIRRGGTLDLVGQTNPVGWQGSYAIKDFPLDEWADGRKSGLTGIMSEGKGDVRGYNGILDVSGTLAGRTTQWLGVRTHQWTLTSLKGRLLPTPELDARIQLENMIWLNTHFDHATAPFHLGDRQIAFTDFDAFAGDTLAKVDGHATWNDRGGWNFNGSRAELKSSRFAWVADGAVILSGDPGGVSFERLIARDGPARLAMSGRWGLPGGSWNWRADVDQLDLSRLGLPLEWKLAGTANAALAVEGPVGQARWTLDGRAMRPAGAGRVIDSVLVRLSGGPSRLEIERARFGLAEGTVDARGVVTGMAKPWADSLLALPIHRWVATASRWEGEVSASGVRLDALSTLVPALDKWRGTVDGTLKVAGRPSAPELDVRGEVTPLGWSDLSVDSLGFEATYAHQDLKLGKVAVRRGGENWKASGHLPVMLAYGEVPRMADQPMDVEVSLPNADLALVPMMVPQIGYAAGTLNLVAHATGTPHKPDIRGTARVRDGRVRLAGRDELIDHLNASIRFTRDAITVDTLTALQTGRQREPGTVRGSGVANLRGSTISDYRFDLALRNFTAIDPLFYIATFDGNFIVQNGPKINGVVVPFVWSDDVRLQRAVVFYDFAKPNQGDVVAASTRPLQWVYDLHVRAKDNLRWTPPDADIEFDADLNVRQSPDTLLLFGDVHALRGWYDFLSTRFTVNQANLTFDDVGGLDPTVDVIATTKFSTPPPSDPNGASQRYTVTVTIQGRSREPNIQFTSDPANLDEAFILKQITIGGDLASGIGGSLDSYLTRQLNRQLSGELQRVFRGYLNELEINREGGLFRGQGDVVMTVGGQILPNVGLRYQQRLASGTHDDIGPVSQTDLFDRNIEAEYRLTRFISLTSGLVQRRATGSTASASPTSEYNVGLRARWEY